MKNFNSKNTMSIQDHKKELLDMYTSDAKSDSSPFMRMVLKQAIWKLNHDTDPNWVEEWVTALEVLWRKTPPKNFTKSGLLVRAINKCTSLI